MKIRYLIIIIASILSFSCEKDNELQIDVQKGAGFYPTSSISTIVGDFQVGAVANINFMFTSKDQIDRIEVWGKYSSMQTKDSLMYCDLSLISSKVYDITSRSLSGVYKIDSTAFNWNVPTGLSVDYKNYMYYKVKIITKAGVVDSLKSSKELIAEKNDASVYEIKVAGKTLAYDADSVKFLPSKYNYRVFVDAGASVPTIVATPKNSKQKVADPIKAINVNGTLAQRTTVLTVLAQDGFSKSTYVVEVDENPKDSLLKSITLKSGTLPSMYPFSFNPIVFKYNITVPATWDIKNPTYNFADSLVATKRSAIQSFVSKAYNVNDSSVTFIHKSEDGTRFSHYKLTLARKVYKKDFCDLKSIKIGSSNLTGFSPSTLEYSYIYQNGSTPPVVSGVLEGDLTGVTISYKDNRQSPDYNSANPLDRVVEITVTAKDGVTKKVYKITFK